LPKRPKPVRLQKRLEEERINAERKAEEAAQAEKKRAEAERLWLEAKEKERKERQALELEREKGHQKAMDLLRESRNKHHEVAKFVNKIDRKEESAKKIAKAKPSPEIEALLKEASGIIDSEWYPAITEFNKYQSALESELSILAGRGSHLASLENILKPYAAKLQSKYDNIKEIYEKIMKKLGEAEKLDI
jgi:hypothetical protein